MIKENIFRDNTEVKSQLSSCEMWNSDCYFTNYFLSIDNIVYGSILKICVNIWHVVYILK